MWADSEHRKGRLPVTKRGQRSPRGRASPARPQASHPRSEGPNWGAGSPRLKCRPGAGQSGRGDWPKPGAEGKATEQGQSCQAGVALDSAPPGGEAGHPHQLECKPRAGEL